MTDKLEALGGVRAEFTHQRYNTQLTPDVTAKSGTIDYADVLPSLQFKYSLSRNQNLRFSYYKALARPGFAELIPDGIDGEFFKEVGNPANLVHTLADNLDVRYELYSKTDNQILLGVFYKNIKAVNYSMDIFCKLGKGFCFFFSCKKYIRNTGENIKT